MGAFAPPQAGNIFEHICRTAVALLSVSKMPLAEAGIDLRFVSRSSRRLILRRFRRRLTPSIANSTMSAKMSI
jgi:hypothetical protein